MITSKDLQRALLKIKNRIFLLIGRAILTAIDNSGETQRMQMTALKGETLDGVERFQEYGFEGYPKVDGKTENIVLFFNGNRDYGVVIKSFNKSFRPKDLIEGEVCMYDWQGHRVIIKKDGTIKSEGNFFHMLAASEAFIKGTTAKVEMDKDQAQMAALKAGITAWVPFAGDGGLALQAALAAFLALPNASYANILSTKIKGE